MASTPEEAFEQFEPPSLEAVLEMVQSIQGMSDEEKESIKRDVIDFALRNGQPGAAEAAAAAATATAAEVASVSPQLLTLLAFVSVIVIVLGFFCYKLIRGMSEKERKKEEKRSKKKEKAKNRSSGKKKSS